MQAFTPLLVVGQSERWSGAEMAWSKGAVALFGTVLAYTSTVLALIRTRLHCTVLGDTD